MAIIKEICESVWDWLEYYPVSGKLLWRKDIVAGNGTVTIKKGSEAGWVDKRFGYRYVSVLDLNKRKRRYLAHRLAWFLHYRSQPQFIDHINGEKDDNRVLNLREVTIQQNCINRKATRSNAGYKGVCFRQRSYKGKKYAPFYEANIVFNGQLFYLGKFESAIEAATTYNNKAIEFFGEYACLNNI